MLKTRGNVSGSRNVLESFSFHSQLRVCFLVCVIGCCLLLLDFFLLFFLFFFFFFCSFFLFFWGGYLLYLFIFIIIIILKQSFIDKFLNVSLMPHFN